MLQPKDAAREGSFIVSIFFTRVGDAPGAVGKFVDHTNQDHRPSSVKSFGSNNVRPATSSMLEGVESRESGLLGLETLRHLRHMVDALILGVVSGTNQTTSLLHPVHKPRNQFSRTNEEELCSPHHMCI